MPDTIISLPTLIISLQMVPFAFSFYYSYSIKPYTTLNLEYITNPQSLVVPDSETTSASVRRYQGGPLGIYARLALLNNFKLWPCAGEHSDIHCT